MDSPNAAFPLSFLRQLLLCYQLDPHKLSRGTELDAQDLLHQDWAPAKDYLAITDNIRRAIDQHRWGLHIGSSIHHGAMGAHGYAVMTAPNLRESLRLMVSYNSLTSPVCRAVIEEGPKEIRVTLQLTAVAPSLAEGLMDIAMSLTYRMLCAPFPSAKDQIAVYYQRSDLNDRLLLEGFFGKLHFHSEHYGFRIPRALYEMDSPLHEPDVWKVAEQACHRQLSQLDIKDSRNVAPIVEERVNASINENYLSGIYRPLVTLEQVADYMETREFALRKALNERAHSFRRIKEQCRRQWLEKLLREPGLSLQAIGLVLGYSEYSNFARACKHWSGLSPKALRAQTYRSYSQEV